MSNFPLYDNMMKGAKNRDLTLKQKAELIKTIENMDEHGMGLVYALIKTHSLNDGSTNSVMPYDGERREQPPGIGFDLEKLPHKLKQALYKFSDVHDKSKIEKII